MTPTVPIRPMILALGLGVLMLGPFLGRPLISREQELRVVLTAREMVRGGDWLVPHYLGEPRLNKPPIQYWLTALAFRAGGTTRSPALARLPTVLLGVALLVAMAGLGASLLGSRRAAAAALMAGSSVLFWRFGRLAETDIPLACFETLAVLCLFMTSRARRPAAVWGWWLGAGIAAGVGFMIKGPAAVALPALAWVTDRWATPRRCRQRLETVPFLAACALCLLIAAPWYAYVRFGYSGAAAVNDIVSELGALGSGTKHAGSPLFYLYTLPLLMFPWGLLLPFALARIWRIARRHDGVRWILCWLLSSLVVMTVIPSKQAHYATLLLAPAAFALAAGFPPRLVRLGRTLRWRRAGIVLSVVYLLALWSTSAVFHELGEPARIVTSVAADVNRLASPDTRVFLAGRRLNSMQYYLDRPIRRIASLDEGLLQASGKDLIIIAADANNPVVPAVPPLAPLLSRRQGPVVMQVYGLPNRVVSGTTPPPDPAHD